MIETLRDLVPYGSTVYHGDARGADRMAHDVLDIYCRDHTGDPDDDVTIIPFPADWDRYGKAAGPRRNQQMLDEMLTHPGPKRVIAFYRGPHSRGTEDMIRRARAAGIETIVVYSEIKKEGNGR